MELASWLGLLGYSDVEVSKGLVKVVQLEVHQASEEVEARRLGGTADDGRVHEVQSLEHFVSLHLVIDELVLHRVGVGPHDRDDIQAEGVLVTWVDETRFREVFGRHQILFGVHLQDTPREPLVVDG